MVLESERLPGGDLLRQHAFGVSLILLRAAQGLGGRIELRVQRHQHAHVVVDVAGQADPMCACLEGGQLGVLVVQRVLGRRYLAAEKIGGFLGNVAARAQVFVHDQGGHGIADFLRALGAPVSV